MKPVKQESRIQAEIGGGAMAPSGELPRKGEYLRGFELASSQGSAVRFADYRGRKSLVLILCDDRTETGQLLRAVADRYEDFARMDAEALAVVHGARTDAMALEQRLGAPYPILFDEDGRLHRELGARDAQGGDAAAVYVTDRFGEVFALHRAAEGSSLPGVEEILRQLEFVSFQCPECEPPEWPA